MQEVQLNELRKKEVPVTLFLKNGVRLQGEIAGFDRFVIILEADNRRQQMIYKNAISTVMPQKDYENKDI